MQFPPSCFSVLKIRHHAVKSSEDDKSADIAMDTNQAYESVQPHHHNTGSGGSTQEEVIYDLPIV